LEKVLEACQSILKSPGQELFYKKHAFKIVSSSRATLVSQEKDQNEVKNLKEEYTNIIVFIVLDITFLVFE
jgi:hypothetical protein